MIIVGLTGSIGMGKSTTAAMFARKGIPVYDADQSVHDLYKTDLIGAIGTAFPGALVGGAIDRASLSKLVVGNEKAMKQLEAIVHPAVQAREKAFLEKAAQAKEPIVVLDIPLLFETGKSEKVDKIVVVTAAPEVQRERVLARAGMSEEKFESILARQTPDAVKRARADFVIQTDKGLEEARKQVDEVISALFGVSSSS